MDELDRTILKTVRKCGKERIEIYQTRLAEMLDKPLQTINRHVRWLVDNGMLIERYVKIDGKLCACLYIPEDEQKSDSEKIDELLRIARAQMKLTRSLYDLLLREDDDPDIL